MARRSRTARGYRSHARQRLAERHGIELQCHELRELEELIGRINAQGGTTREGRAIERQTSSRTLYEVAWRERTLYVVWSHTQRTLVTVLPQQCREAAALAAE